MSASRQEPVPATPPPKAPLWIAKAAHRLSGLDELTSGGLPCGGPTLVCGGASTCGGSSRKKPGHGRPADRSVGTFSRALVLAGELFSGARICCL
jgi:hypothetical protein